MEFIISAAMMDLSAYICNYISVCARECYQCIAADALLHIVVLVTLRMQLQ